LDEIDLKKVELILQVFDVGMRIVNNSSPVKNI